MDFFKISSRKSGTDENSTPNVQKTNFTANTFLQCIFRSIAYQQRFTRSCLYVIIAQNMQLQALISDFRFNTKHDLGNLHFWRIF